MHLFFISRGIKYDRDRFVQNLSNLYVPMKNRDSSGIERTDAIQCILQPVELWSLVFPEENYENMMRTLNPNTTMGFNIEKWKKPAPKRAFSLALLRKSLGLKKLPEWKKEGNRYPLWRENMQILALGIKEDYRNEQGNECL